MDRLFPLADEWATARLGAALGEMCRIGDVIALAGPLGAGKTTLARGIIAAATGAAEAASPTFSLVETYAAKNFTLYHFDLYRLEKAEEVWELGFEEAEGGVAIIEWPERIEALLPPSTLLIRLSMDDPGRRALMRGGPAWEARLSHLNPL